jgi:hypothetical protein
MPNFKKNTGYKPFKMKGSPMKRNFGIGGSPAKQTMPTSGEFPQPGVMVDVKNPASPMMRKSADPTIRELKRTLRKGKWVKGPRKGEELSDRDRISVEEQLRDLQQAKDDPGSKYHPAYDKEGPGKKSGLKKKSPAKNYKKGYYKKSPTKMHTPDHHNIAMPGKEIEAKTWKGGNPKGHML